MKLLVTFVALIAVSQASIINSKEWEIFKAKFGKQYENHTEEILRMNIFLNHSHRIEIHNKMYKQGLASYKMAVNKFSDLPYPEFIQKYGGFLRYSENINNSNLKFVNRKNVSLPDSIDWRERGAVTEIKDQSDCGSCWAFSTTGSIEGAYFLKTGKLVSLSEQNLVDCSTPQGNAGCMEGLMDSAFDYVIANGGIDTEESYPYQGYDDDCRYDPQTVGAQISGYVDIKTGDEKDLQQAIGTVGPVSISICATDDFMNYAGGIFDEETCPSDRYSMNHGVLAVGYGSENDKDYYIVKNSWGIFWGEEGYVRMARNRGNQCGVATLASYPIVTV